MRGVLSYIFAFILVSTILISLFFIVNPTLLNFLSFASQAGSEIINSTNLSGIQNPTVKAALNESLTTAEQGIPHSANIISTSIKYAWLIFLLVMFALFFVLTRELSEMGYQRGVV